MALKHYPSTCSNTCAGPVFWDSQTTSPKPQILNPKTLKPKTWKLWILNQKTLCICSIFCNLSYLIQQHDILCLHHRPSKMADSRSLWRRCSPTFRRSDGKVQKGKFNHQRIRYVQYIVFAEKWYLMKSVVFWTGLDGFCHHRWGQQMRSDNRWWCMRVKHGRWWFMMMLCYDKCRVVTVADTWWY